MGMEPTIIDYRIIEINGEVFEFVPGLGLVLMD